MLVLGIETSCDETGVALYDSRPGAGLLAHALYSQVSMHAEYGGVVPELASRDHIRRVLPLVRQVLAESGTRASRTWAGSRTPRGPGWPARCWSAPLSPALWPSRWESPRSVCITWKATCSHRCCRATRPAFRSSLCWCPAGIPNSCGWMASDATRCSGETLDDAAGEAFDKTAQLLGLGYPGGPAVSRLAEHGDPTRFKLPRPMLTSADLNFSFSGLKTAVLIALRQRPADDQSRADLAAGVEAAIVDVLTPKAMAALEQTGLDELVVAGGVGANRLLRRQRLSEEADRQRVVPCATRNWSSAPTTVR